jgi:hypothetical protein
MYGNLECQCVQSVVSHAGRIYPKGKQTTATCETLDLRPGNQSSSPTRHGAPFPSAGFSETSSEPPTPTEGFTQEQVKSMAKVWNSKLVETMLMVVTTYTENEADTNKVTEILSNILEMNVILFYLSGLMVVVKPGKNLLYPDEIRPRQNDTKRLWRPNQEKCPSPSNGIPRRVHSRPQSPPSGGTISCEVEARCRPIIALFLSFAVNAARKLFKNERLTVHSEVPIPNVQILQVGLVEGTLDFMTASVIGEGPMSKFFTSTTSNGC